MDTDQIEYIIDHYKNPRNYGSLKEADISHEEGNPLCGDVIRFDIKIKNNKVDETRFTGKGCAISQAAASILTEEMKGKSLEEIKNISNEQILDLLPVKVSHLRIKCGLLASKALQKA